MRTAQDYKEVTTSFNMNFIEKTKRQFDRWARVYDSFLFRIYFEPLYKRLLAMIDHEAHDTLKKGGTFLDVACGTGEIMYRLAKRYPKSEFYGIDLSPEMIKKAKEKANGAKNLIFQAGTVDELPFQDNAFDIVLCSEAFHHFEHPKRSLEEMRRVLREGGIFLLMDPAYDVWWQKIIVRIADIFETNEKAYPRKEFFELFQNAGFRTEYSFYWRFNNFFLARK